MKRGTLFFAAVLLIGGVLRISGPRAAGAREKGSQSPPKEETAAQTSAPITSSYGAHLDAKIHEFLQNEPAKSKKDRKPSTPAAQPTATSKPSKILNAKFVIALVPDPVHTHLGLFFDRSIEAIQQAAQMKGYVFDNAVMPWSRAARNEASDRKTRREEAAVQAEREVFPGLMIFRREEVVEGNSDRSPLFVFVVGETPTAGLNRQQFCNAVQRVVQTQGASASSEGTKDPLLILGPTFSGSLESLEQELNNCDWKAVASQAYIFSGTATAQEAVSGFQQATKDLARFATFQENDDYARAAFLQFISDRGYQPSQVAILSEDQTVYGSLRPDCLHGKAAAKQEQGRAPQDSQSSRPVTPSDEECSEPSKSELLDREVLKLHFPREISYFRSAYENEAASQQATAPPTSGVSTLPLDLAESGSDGDTVAPYAVTHTVVSQEAVILGIVSELQKHRIKFTLLLATDPLDELFLAGYLRKAYAQGQVVITAPDLLFAREGDPTLRGVLGLNAYSLIPGLSDQLCRQEKWTDWHEDRLFVSSGNIGTFNAMVGLLSVKAEAQENEKSSSGASQKSGPEETEKPAVAKSAARQITAQIPSAPYAEYGSPALSRQSGAAYCEERPLLWLTILGRDGFWPVAGLSDNDFHSADGQTPIAYVATQGRPPSTLLTAEGSYAIPAPAGSSAAGLRTPPAWRIAYCLCFLLLLIHAVFSWTGSILADSEARAQFARSTDLRGTLILAIGAFTLASAFVLMMCTRNPQLTWSGFRGLTILLWLPYALFLAATIWDLANLRHARLLAAAFTLLVGFMTWGQLWLTLSATGGWRVYWSTRMLYLSSGVSPVLPVLLLMAAVYWWMWMSLRGVSLVDLRRPRLPEQHDLPSDSYRITDSEGESLRRTAHPFYFTPRVLLPIIAVAAVLFTVLDHQHPVQTIEGGPYDLGYVLLLGLLAAVFLGCVLKIVWTWLKCRQVLAGLDRLPLRDAFGRMKGLTWHSFWNPGGSTLRQTYKVLERALENQARLLVLVENWNTPMTDSARQKVRTQIRESLETRQSLIDAYGKIVSKQKQKQGQAGNQNRRRRFFSPGWLERAEQAVLRRLHPAFLLRLPRRIWQEKKTFLKEDYRTGWRLRSLMRRIESLQKQMAKTAAVLIREVLRPLWDEEAALVVSTDERITRSPLPVFRAMAEEHAALVYVNFLVSVLLRIRTLVICAAGMYVFLVLSMNTYPFEPHPALQTLEVVLLLVMAAAVGYVYAEMHRDVILSRLTSTSPGELGLDFWIKFASAGAIPVFSLLASQFPSINQFLFSWLEPALQAMK
jgi:hypothetical protein